MKLNDEMKKLIAFSLIVSAIIGIFLMYYFGLAGLKVFIGIIIASIPFYVFFNTLDLNEGEKIVLSIILGITLFPSFVYLLGFFVSFRISIAIVFVVLIGIAVGWRYFKPKN